MPAFLACMWVLVLVCGYLCLAPMRGNRGWFFRLYHGFGALPVADAETLQKKASTSEEDSLLLSGYSNGDLNVHTPSSFQ